MCILKPHRLLTHKEYSFTLWHLNFVFLLLFYISAGFLSFWPSAASSSDRRINLFFSREEIIEQNFEKKLVSVQNKPMLLQHFFFEPSQISEQLIMQVPNVGSVCLFYCYWFCNINNIFVDFFIREKLIMILHLG